ncbi:MAG: helix-turn-helix transcriptional regulator [Clostridia bacterium]|jgi:DNA-binding Xre family transcriptional regulator|nr:helix-turn-helix transcriptional regulator [Clostridia bacterium]
MKLEEAITKRIYNLCNERNIAPNKLAAMAGLPSATLRCIFYGRSKNPGARTLLDICQALDITLYDFFNDPLFKTANLEGTY